VAVDTKNHVITGAMSNFADRRDAQCLEELCEQTDKNLKEHGMKINQLLADTGYSSGEALKYLEEKEINAYIPNFGKYKPYREGFIYNNELDRYECQRGNKAILPLKNANVKNGDTIQKRYSGSANECKNCSLREKCCGKKMKYKKLDDSIHKEYYGRMHKKLTGNIRYAKALSRIRSSTVEPVLGTLINFMSMARVNTRGIDLVNKHVLMAALAYNLKKCLKYSHKIKTPVSAALPVVIKSILPDIFFIFAFFRYLTTNFLNRKIFYREIAFC
jgi:hypothetical protein